MHSISSKSFFFYCTYGTEEKSVSSAQGSQENISTWDWGYLCHIASQPVRPLKIFFQVHFLKLRYQAQLGNQAFLWFVYNSILTSPNWLKCNGGGGGEDKEGNIFVTCTRKTNGKSSINPIFFVVFTGNNITLSRCAPFKVVSDVEAVQGKI